MSTGKSGQSCGQDECRRRKVKCSAPLAPSTVSNAPIPAASRPKCSRCRELVIPCVFAYVPRRRGPPKGYVRVGGHLAESEQERGSKVGSQHVVDLDRGTINISVTDIIAVDVAEQLFGLFFDYVWHLIPCLHRPIFMRDWRLGRHSWDPEFAALVLAVLGCTIVSLPKAWVPFDSSEIKSICLKCQMGARLIYSTFLGATPSITKVTTYYLCAVTCCAIDPGLDDYTVLFGAACGAAMTLRLFDSDSYLGLDPIESQSRKRMFWLLYNADKSFSCLRRRPSMMRFNDWDVHRIDLPTSIEEEFSPRQSIITEPEDTTRVVAGFNHVIDLFMILDDTLQLKSRVFNGGRSSHVDWPENFRQLDDLLRRTLQAMHNCDDELQLRAVWGTATAIDFHKRPDAESIKSTALLVCQANIYATQQLVRFFIAQCRKQFIQRCNSSSGDWLLLDKAAWAVQRDVDFEHEFEGEDYRAIAYDLLEILKCIPIDSLASNGPVITEKVRYVACGLLEDDENFLGSSPPTSETMNNYKLHLDLLALLEAIDSRVVIG